MYTYTSALNKVSNMWHKWFN